jgi:hypothetical protein
MQQEGHVFAQLDNDTAFHAVSGDFDRLLKGFAVDHHGGDSLRIRERNRAFGARLHEKRLATYCSDVQVNALFAGFTEFGFKTR